MTEAGSGICIRVIGGTAVEDEAGADSVRRATIWKICNVSFVCSSVLIYA